MNVGQECFQSQSLSVSSRKSISYTGFDLFLTDSSCSDRNFDWVEWIFFDFGEILGSFIHPLPKGSAVIKTWLPRGVFSWWLCCFLVFFQNHLILEEGKGDGSALKLLPLMMFSLVSCLLLFANQIPRTFNQCIKNVSGFVLYPSRSLGNVTPPGGLGVWGWNQRVYIELWSKSESFITLEDLKT